MNLLKIDEALNDKNFNNFLDHYEFEECLHLLHPEDRAEFFNLLLDEEDSRPIISQWFKSVIQKPTVDDLHTNPSWLGKEYEITDSKIVKGLDILLSLNYNNLVKNNGNGSFKIVDGKPFVEAVGSINLQIDFDFDKKNTVPVYIAFFTDKADGFKYVDFTDNDPVNVFNSQDEVEPDFVKGHMIRKLNELIYELIQF